MGIGLNLLPVVLEAVRGKEIRHLLQPDRARSLCGPPETRAVKKRLLDYLACPDCLGDVRGDFEGELEHGEIYCLGCARVFQVIHGVPDMRPFQEDSLRLRVAAEFAEQWQHYSQRRELYHQQFFDWVDPVGPEFLVDKVVLDAGCGKGRHLSVTARCGASLVIGVDLGEAAYVAQEATREIGNVQVVRGDLLSLPFKDDAFDYAYSVGVLHHLPEPAAGFHSVLTKVKPRGHISAWVYGYENNQWIVHLLNPIRENVTTKMPRRLLKWCSWVLALVVLGVVRWIYEPWHRSFPDTRLFYQDYLLYISHFPIKEIETIVYDQLNPRVAHYLSKAIFEAWFQDLEEVSVNWHNQNSWRGFARKKG